jgi:bleomycin hydrolase
MKHYNIDEFEFSQSYLFFYDKLERCHYFLNNVVETYGRGERVDGRLVSYLLQDPCSDGGQWDMVSNLVLRYGLMPKKNFQESFSSESTNRLNSILKSKLREFCKELRTLMDQGKSQEEVQLKVDEQLSQIFRIISICLGVPKEKFIWEYYDKTKNYKKVGPITPQKFYEEYVKPVYNIEDKICLVNDPREIHPYNQAYTVDCLGNTVGGNPIIYNNQHIDLLEQVASNSIKKGEPVWFGCEVVKRFAAKQGIEDLTIHDYSLVFGTDVTLGLTKAERLLYGESCMTHAMVFTACSVDDNGKVTKWRVENSWGDDRGDKGYFVMSADWFKEFVFELVVDKSVVPPDVLEVFKLEPTVLPAWDPMGTLACRNSCSV